VAFKIFLVDCGLDFIDYSSSSYKISTGRARESDSFRKSSRMAQKKLWNIAFSGSEDEMRNLLLNRSNVDVNEENTDRSCPLHKAIQHNQDTGVAKVQSFPLNDSCITKELKEFWFVCVSTDSVFVLNMYKGPVGASYNRRELRRLFRANTTAHSVN
jgi:hypothetical protein